MSPGTTLASIQAQLASVGPVVTKILVGSEVWAELKKLDQTRPGTPVEHSLGTPIYLDASLPPRAVRTYKEGAL